MSSLPDKHRIDPLPFRVDPHMLEDLGLNLYSSLPRVLVEFIANAYDADAPMAEVAIDFPLINSQRREMREIWRKELSAAHGDTHAIDPLEDRLLPEDTVISVQDTGHGMTVDELREKFLVAGRRRRLEEDTTLTRGGRTLMGRKGLGKLAGFGVARRIEVITKVEGNFHAYGIRLDYDEIMRLTDTQALKVPTFQLPDDGGLGTSGTRVMLSRLVHESVKNREDTVRQSIGDHFVLIDQEDFAIRLNGTAAEPAVRNLVFAWPEPTRPVDEFVTHSIDSTETGTPVQFSYRLRFVEDRASLLASQRGVRVYANKRLAAAPSLLHADTNMHGFRMTDYLDGVVYADFIDSLGRDYIATDRQGLRWETPLLQPVHEFLGTQIKEACKEYQKFRDKAKQEEVRQDAFTARLIKGAQLSRREERLAVSVCTRLASFHREGVNTPDYQEHARLLVQAIGKGEIFTAISELSQRAHPLLQDLAGEVTRLTHAEIDQTLAGMRSRLLAIDTLQRIVADTNFAEGNNEDALHELLKESPWLIDPTYFEFLTSDRTVGAIFQRLERDLGIGAAVPDSYDKGAPEETEPMKENRRPDLVFLLGSEGLRRVVIVELKAPNTPLLNKHLLQLRDYMRKAERFLRDRSGADVAVEGRLIGTLDRTRGGVEIDRLAAELEERGPSAKWEVYDLSQLLTRTRSAHKEFLEIYEETTDQGE